jgi:peptidyl-prolyl cis-trans isomerase C
MRLSNQFDEDLILFGYNLRHISYLSRGVKMANTAAALHILVKHKEQAEDIIKQLKKGAKFQTLAKKYSTCPSGKRGGDLGEFRRGQMVPQFDKVCFSGETLVPHLVKTKFGWHVVKVLYRT